MKTNRAIRLRGFTLVEIMIVIAIIALLAAIAIPSLLRAVSKSQSAACINNLRQIDTAVQQYSVAAGKHVGDVINFPDDLKPYIKLTKAGELPGCPGGGEYSLTTVGTVPSALCSLGSTVTPAHQQQ